MARRLADEILENPLDVLCLLSKTELHWLMIREGRIEQNITRKMRKTCYKLQKYAALVLTYKDYEAGEWKMLIPDCVRESLLTCFPAILSIVEKNEKTSKYRGLENADVSKWFVKKYF